jgi:rRNA maturation RNase YbeY
MPPVRFNYADVPPIALKGKREIKQCVEEIFKLENKRLHLINYIFCSDSFLLQINRAYLKHDFFTDIITFDLSEENGSKGEIYISIDRVRENACIHHTSFRNELMRVIFHGALHLCGYKDKKKSEITLMRQKEEYYLRLFEKNNL